MVFTAAEAERPSLSRQSSSGQSTIPFLGEFSTLTVPPVKMDEKERPNFALQILKLICDSTVLKPHLRDLLSSRYRKIAKNSDTWKIAVISLKVEQGGFTLRVMHPNDAEGI